MFMLKKLAHLALYFFQFAVVILHEEQSTSIEIYASNADQSLTVFDYAKQFFVL